MSYTCNENIRYGLGVRIAGSHPAGPGSIPGNGKFWEYSVVIMCILFIVLVCILDGH